MGWFSKCEGGECPKKHTCHRYLAPVNMFYQVWFNHIPYHLNRNISECYYENPVNSGCGNNNTESDKQQGTPDVAGQQYSAAGHQTAGGTGAD